MRKIIICDLDGCLIDSAWIWDVINSNNIQGPEMWDFFNRNANALINKIDKCLLNYLALQITGGALVLFLTARSQEIETETINFIQQRTGLVFGRHFITSFRSRNDDSPAVESKRIRLEAVIMGGSQIIAAIDDEKEICEMYKAKGITTYKWEIGMLPVAVVEQYGSNISHLTGKEVLCLN